MMPAVGLNCGDAPAQLGGVAVALGDEDRAGAGQVRGRLAQRAARQQMLVAERLLAVDQHDVLPPPAQFPVLKPVVQQQRVAAELLDGVAAALDPVLVHQHHHVLEIGGEHVRLVAGHFGIEQQRFAVRDDAGRGGVVAEKELVQQPFVERRRLGAVAAGEDGHVAALVAQFAGEFFDHGGFAGAADGEVADGDDLHAERRVAQDADVVEKAADLDGGLGRPWNRRGASRARAPRACPRRSSKMTSRTKVSSSSVQARSVSRISDQCAKVLRIGQAEGSGGNRQCAKAYWRQSGEPLQIHGYLAQDY